jgi:hypothetical protein
VKKSLQMTFGLGLVAVMAVAQAQSCDEAWARYNDFKKNNVMESSEYARTVYGAQVRAACGDSALPVPAGTDTPHRVIRRPVKPTQPVTPPPTKPSKSN